VERDRFRPPGNERNSEARWQNAPQVAEPTGLTSRVVALENEVHGLNSMLYAFLPQESAPEEQRLVPVKSVPEFHGAGIFNLPPAVFRSASCDRFSPLEFPVPIANLQLAAFEVAPPASDGIICLPLEGSSTSPFPSKSLALPQHSIASPRHFGNLDPQQLVNFIASRTATEVAPSIAEYLTRHASNASGPITKVKATMIQPFSNQYSPWPLMSWHEGDETEIMAIFKVSNALQPCSCLMHYGVERTWGTRGPKWKGSHVAWVVENIEDVAELFVAAWHVSGILRPLNVKEKRVKERLDPLA
jgi:hypothetical protein